MSVINYRLSGNQHSVVTGVSIFYKSTNANESGFKEKLFSETTKVNFSKLTEAIINAYVRDLMISVSLLENYYLFSYNYRC